MRSTGSPGSAADSIRGSADPRRRRGARIVGSAPFGGYSGRAVHVPEAQEPSPWAPRCRPPRASPGRAATTSARRWNTRLGTTIDAPARSRHRDPRSHPLRARRHARAPQVEGGCEGIRPGSREPRFTFGLWTVGNPGRDPFGERRVHRSTPSSACSASPSSARTGVASTTTTSCRPARPPAEREAIVEAVPRARSTRPACGCRWRRPTCSRTRCSRTARSPPTTRGAALRAAQDARRDRPRGRARRRRST